MRGLVGICLLSLLACRQREPASSDAASIPGCDGVPLATSDGRVCGSAWQGDVQVLLSAADYRGTLTPCESGKVADDADFLLSVEASAVRPTSDDPAYGHTTTVVSTRLQGGDACGVALLVSLKGRVVNLPLGKTIRYVRKRVVRDFEADVSLSVAVRNENGELLLGWASGQREATWDSDVFPELKLRGTSQICNLSSKQVGLAFDLTADGACHGRHWEESCCRLGAGAFILRTISAYRLENKDNIQLFMGRTNVIVPGGAP
jgi:hypothetical protein